MLQPLVSAASSNSVVYRTLASRLLERLTEPIAEALENLGLGDNELAAIELVPNTRLSFSAYRDGELVGVVSTPVVDSAEEEQRADVSVGLPAADAPADDYWASEALDDFALTVEIDEDFD